MAVSVKTGEAVATSSGAHGFSRLEYVSSRSGSLLGMHQGKRLGSPSSAIWGRLDRRQCPGIIRPRQSLSDSLSNQLLLFSRLLAPT